MMGAAGAAAAMPGFAQAANGEKAAAPRDVPPRNRRPYSGLDWSKVQRIKTTSHGHCTGQGMLDVYMKRGFEFLTISNYYPSAPTYPGKTFRKFHYHVNHDWPVVVNGKLTPGPFDWNKIIEPFKDEIHKWHKKDYPFKEGGPLYPNWPDGILEAPNAEHHNIIDPATGRGVGGLHMCAPGSAFKSGTIDAHGIYATIKRGYCSGMRERWDVALPKIFEQLIVPDGGGVTINHPTWTKLSRDMLARLLDFDPRVLGIEVLECCGVNSENYWDWALATGRQCFGFFVPDWGANKEVKGGIDRKRDFGVNVLCVEERTVEACLRAYRQGNFYGAAHGLDELAFTNISFDGKTLYAQTDRPANLEVITARGVVKSVKGTSIEWTVTPDGSCVGPKVDVFARVRAKSADDVGETLFSQAMMLV